jgi:hypothetical protein
VSVKESAKPAPTLTVMWTGRRWTVECSIPTERLQPRYPLTPSEKGRHEYDHRRRRLAQCHRATGQREER